MQNRKNLKMQPKIIFVTKLPDDKFAFMKVLVNKRKETSMVCSNDSEMIIRKTEKVMNNEQIKTIDIKIVQEYDKIKR